MDLLGNPGHLLLTSTSSDIRTGKHSVMEASGVLLAGIGTQDFRVSARFNNVHVIEASDQLLLYAGTSVDKIFRAGFHEGNPPNQGQITHIWNFGSGDLLLPATTTGPRFFSTGDDFILSLARMNSIWSLDWTNLTNLADSGSFTDISIPLLDAEDDLYVGVMHMDARNSTSQTAEIDYFIFTGLDGDYNLNGIVDAADYTVWRDTLGQTVALGTGADGNEGGYIGLEDYQFWKDNFSNGPATTASSNTPVPEPTAAVLVLMTCVGWMRFYNRPLGR
jgi:hypothetical protein